MPDPVLVQIVGAPACAQGQPATWRSVSVYVAQQLALRFGDRVRVIYFDVFEEGCPSLPDDAQLPLVRVGEEVLSSGGKISVPAIRRAVEARVRGPGVKSRP
jgi:hypothetical protein